MIWTSRRNSAILVCKIAAFSVYFRRIVAVSNQMLHLPLVKKSILVKTQTLELAEFGPVVDSRISVT